LAAHLHFSNAKAKQKKCKRAANPTLGQGLTRQDNTLTKDEGQLVTAVWRKRGFSAS